MSAERRKPLREWFIVVTNNNRVLHEHNNEEDARVCCGSSYECVRVVEVLPTPKPKRGKRP